MSLRRQGRLHQTVAAQQSEVYWDYQPDQRVITIDGPGRVIAVSDGPFPGAEEYEIRLEGGLGGGTYTPSQIKAATPVQASVGTTDASVSHLASEDYPELGTILYDRPDPATIRHTAELGSGGDSGGDGGDGGSSPAPSSAQVASGDADESGVGWDPGEYNNALYHDWRLAAQEPGPNDIARSLDKFKDEQEEKHQDDATLVPDFKPLQLSSLKPEEHSGWMFMERKGPQPMHGGGQTPPLFSYKHGITRTPLHLDDEGQSYGMVAGKFAGARAAHHDLNSKGHYRMLEQMGASPSTKYDNDYIQGRNQRLTEHGWNVVSSMPAVTASTLPEDHPDKVYLKLFGHLTLGPNPEDRNALKTHLLSHHGYTNDQLSMLDDPGQGDDLVMEHEMEHHDMGSDGISGEFGRGEIEHAKVEHDHKGKGGVANRFPETTEFNFHGTPQGHYLSSLSALPGVEASTWIRPHDDDEEDLTDHLVNHHGQDRRHIGWDVYDHHDRLHQEADDEDYMGPEPEGEPHEHHDMRDYHPQPWEGRDRSGGSSQEEEHRRFLAPGGGHDYKPVPRTIQSLNHLLVTAAHDSSNFCGPACQTKHEQAVQWGQRQEEWGDGTHCVNCAGRIPQLTKSPIPSGDYDLATPEEHMWGADVKNRQMDAWRVPNHTLSLLVTAAMDPGFRFHVTAAWRDVQAKAVRIRKAGGVNITHASEGYVIANVQGDHHVYETGLQRVPGRRTAVAVYSCGCKWGAYHWGADDDMSRFAGRMCSHALALQYEAQARGMFGRDVTVDDTKPRWVPSKVVVKYDIDDGRNIQARSSLVVPEQAPLLAMLALADPEAPGFGMVLAAVNDLFGDNSGATEPLMIDPAGPTVPWNKDENPTSAGGLASGEPSNWGRINSPTMYPRLGSNDGAEATFHEEPEPALPSTDGEDHTASLGDVDLTGGSGIGGSESIGAMGDDELSPENPSMQTMGAQEIVAAFQRSAGAKHLMDSGKPGDTSNSDIAGAAEAYLQKTSASATEFSLAEREALINENPGVQASNTDRLDIAGTHYEELDKHASMEEDDYLWMA